MRYTLLDPAFVPKGTTLVSLFSFLIFSLVTTTFLLLLLKPEIVFRIFDWICAAARRRFPRIAPFLERAVLKVEELVTEHKTFSQMFIRQHKGVVRSAAAHLRFSRCSCPRQLCRRQSLERRCNPVGTHCYWDAAQLRSAVRTNARCKRRGGACNRRIGW